MNYPDLKEAKMLQLLGFSLELLVISMQEIFENEEGGIEYAACDLRDAEFFDIILRHIDSDYDPDPIIEIDNLDEEAVTAMVTFIGSQLYPNELVIEYLY